MRQALVGHKPCSPRFATYACHGQAMKLRGADTIREPAERSLIVRNHLAVRAVRDVRTVP